MTYTTNALSHGIGNDQVSKQWFSRPDDQRFTSLSDVYSFKANDAAKMSASIVNTHRTNVIGDIETNGLKVQYTDENNQDAEKTPTNWSFQQLANLAKAPASYLHNLPSTLAADCMNWGLRHQRGKELIKTYGGLGELRACTGPDYGRIFDWEIIKSVMNMNEGTGNRWKIPGQMTGARDGMAVYDPDYPITKENTPLFASDRDIFLFLVDDKNPIEVGKTARGEPDLMFRGFYAWNSEVGSKTAGFASMYLRGVCANRCLWGVEDFSEVKIRHSKFASDRFADEAIPALNSFVEGSTQKIVDGVQKAKEAIIATEDEKRLEFLTKRVGLSQRMAKAAVARHLEEEDKPMNSIWDTVQAITAVARDIPHQDNRVTLEKNASALLEKV